MGTRKSAFNVVYCCGLKRCKSRFYHLRWVLLNSALSHKDFSKLNLVSFIKKTVAQRRELNKLALIILSRIIKSWKHLDVYDKYQPPNSPWTNLDNTIPHLYCIHTVASRCVFQIWGSNVVGRQPIKTKAQHRQSDHDKQFIGGCDSGIASLCLQCIKLLFHRLPWNFFFNFAKFTAPMAPDHSPH